MKVFRVSLLLLLSIGVLFPLTWHFFLLDAWIQSIPISEREVDIGIGVFLGYVASLIVMGACGLIVILCSMSLKIKSTFYKVVFAFGVIEILIPSTVFIVTYLE